MDETVLASWRRLAERVRDELVAAALPVAIEGTVKDAGAVVEVDPVADDSGGVWVYWQVHPSCQTLPPMRCSWADWTIQRSGAVKQVMQVALLALLGGVGYQVEDPATNTGPFSCGLSLNRRRGQPPGRDLHDGLACRRSWQVRALACCRRCHSDQRRRWAGQRRAGRATLGSRRGPARAAD